MLLQMLVQKLTSGAKVKSCSHLWCGMEIILSDLVIILYILAVSFFLDLILKSSEGIGKRSRFIFLVLYADRTEDYNWRNSKYCVLLMPNLWTRCGNETSVLFWKMCCNCVMPFSAHVRNCRGVLSIRRSGLFQIGLSLDGAYVELVTLWNFHQAVRVEDIVEHLKHGWCFIEALQKGKAEIGMFWQNISSMSRPVLFDGVGCVHLYIYCKLIDNK